MNKCYIDEDDKPESLLGFYIKFATFLLVIYLIARGFIYMNHLECDHWGGEYHWSTGCLMHYNGIKIPLSEYKMVTVTQITKPIPTNFNLNLSEQQ